MHYNNKSPDSQHFYFWYHYFTKEFYAFLGLHYPESKLARVVLSKDKDIIENFEQCCDDAILTSSLL